MLCFGERLATVCLQYFQRFIEIEGITILVLARPSFLQKCLGEMCGGEWSWWWWAGSGRVCCSRFLTNDINDKSRFHFLWVKVCNIDRLAFMFILGYGGRIESSEWI